jgi:hypothetical protein
MFPARKSKSRTSHANLILLVQPFSKFRTNSVLFEMGFSFAPFFSICTLNSSCSSIVAILAKGTKEQPGNNPSYFFFLRRRGCKLVLGRFLEQSIV